MYRFLPWKRIVRRAARAYGIADPALWLARLRNFSQPSEVQEPIELLRAGVHFHARGLINTKAIQHNLDWVWPYWVQRQFDPTDSSFVPRGFSFSHINLTHRNWTAIGLPELSVYPIVDPRGLVTPLHDGWSIDCWLVNDDGRKLIPSQLRDDDVRQRLLTDDGLAVETICEHNSLTLKQTARVVVEDGDPIVRIDVAAGASGGALAVAIRPYNPEGVQFVDRLFTTKDRPGWNVNDKTDVLLSKVADHALTSHYDEGDVIHRLASANETANNNQTVDQHCDTGMATAASVYQIRENSFDLTIRVPLDRELHSQGNPKRFNPAATWSGIRSEIASLHIPDQRLQKLYDASTNALILLSADEIVPGPYTYKRFWFRDACLMMNPMLAVGLKDRCRRAIERFPARQDRNGYFRSQEGEWDSNGQVLWILDRYSELTQERLPDAVLKTLDKAVDWIDHKRTPSDSGEPHAGLLPAGFSAEHLGPNDFYFWDDFWAEAGLRSVARIWEREGRNDKASRARRLAAELRSAIERSLDGIPESRSLGGIPASPYRRMDAGAVGSLVADYPLQLTDSGDSRIQATVDALVKRSFHNGGFFQDMIHSGINVYLTLDIAQTMLRFGDERWRELVQTVAHLASPTGMWPEAIHPNTGGGCMGDGQHGWAAAEWVMMLRNCFVREECDRLVIGSGVCPEWLESDDDLFFGPTLTPWGNVSVRIIPSAEQPLLTLDAAWHREPPRIDLDVAGFRRLSGVDCDATITLDRLLKSECSQHSGSDVALR